MIIAEIRAQMEEITAASQLYLQKSSMQLDSDIQDIENISQ